jgi:ABC-type uncharacterized transport system substrate-binding protein
MRRREFISILGGAAAAWPLGARAQQTPLPVLGFLRNTSAASSTNLVAAFRQGLKEVGYIEGQNLAIEFRWSDGRDDQLPIMAADLVGLPVAVLVAANLTALVAAKAATKSIPIVFVTGDDPIQLGFVSSFNRPTDNITGISFYSGTLGTKQLELLHQLVPNAVLIGMLVNPNNPAADGQIAVVQAAAKTLGVQTRVATPRSENDVEPVFAGFAQQHVSAVLIGGDALFNSQRSRIAKLAAHHAMPTIHFAPEYVAAGGLMSYGASIADAYRQVGLYAGRLLKGAKPSELPIMLPTKFELLINLKAAKSLALTIPPGVLAIADEVIE